ncbi:MAG TPA: bifunctional acetate--CoA ligase family protein/GNAT family N-acetyltransferase [Steroidobacteraceae bacterium]|nr:bifunctional acetate--CoA ligase family protein/GNAT family N-acetyltransferase [Steroidobacteraceae bacterium]
MSTRNLKYLLRPRSVAVIGASDTPHSVGATVIRNALGGGFAGPVWPVNLRHTTIAGERAYRSVDKLPEAPDLAVICTPPATVPGLIAELGACGTRAAVVLTTGLDATLMDDGRTAVQAMLETARPHCLRILGPNCVGLLVPGIGLNASFAHVSARPGELAFISQSGALTTAMLDWARANQFGFSHFLSLGKSADIDFGDLLDYLGSDADTRAVLLYAESIGYARKFMSAARAAARNKPVIVVKAGRSPLAAKAAASHTGALAGVDAVYDAAFRRAGMLRVDTTRELFGAAETLARIRGVKGNRLAIISNGGGPAVMATDALIRGGGRLAELAPETMQALDAVLPATWSRSNPVDIIGDAPVERYVAALRPLTQDRNADAILLIHAPTAIVQAEAVARDCAQLLSEAPHPALVCWLGTDSITRADAMLARAGLPTFATPEEAVTGFLQLVAYHENQQQLLETPPSVAEDFEPDPESARAVIAAALAEGRTMLTEPESKRVLAAYAIPVVETEVARSLEELPGIGDRLGYPLALKIHSPDITHKTDVGGVVLDIGSEELLLAAAEAILARARKRRPDARIEGLSVQKMIEHEGGHELILGIAIDAIFGPVLMFGQGGTAVETIADRAIALPPLNIALARELMGRTRVAKLLGDSRSHRPVNLAAVELALVKLSQLAADLPEVAELDVNPLLADAHGVVALDARIRIDASAPGGRRHFAIRPYPKELEQTIGFGGGTVLLRPIRPEDRAKHEAFIARNTPNDMHARFFRMVRELPASEMARFTQIDYEREMAFIAVGRDEAGAEETLGVARAHADADNVEAEFAIIVRSDLKGHGLGAALLTKLIDYCRGRGTLRLVGEVFADNERMLRLSRDCGFRIVGRHDAVVDLSLDLQA